MTTEPTTESTTEPTTADGTAGGAVTAQVNDETRTFTTGTTLRDLVAEVTGRHVTAEGRAGDGAGLGVAVAVAGEVLPRGEWAATQIVSGDRIEVVTAVQGG